MSTEIFRLCHWMNNRPNGIEQLDFDIVISSPAMEANLNKSFLSLPKLKDPRFNAPK